MNKRFSKVLDSSSSNSRSNKDLQSPRDKYENEILFFFGKNYEK